MPISPSYSSSSSSSSCFAGLQPSQNKEYRYKVLKDIKNIPIQVCDYFKSPFCKASTRYRPK